MSGRSMPRSRARLRTAGEAADFALRACTSAGSCRSTGFALEADAADEAACDADDDVCGAEADESALEDDVEDEPDAEEADAAFAVFALPPFTAPPLDEAPSATMPSAATLSAAGTSTGAFVAM